MNGQQALKRARELLGRRARIEVRKPRYTPEQRESARARLRELGVERAAAEVALAARRKAVLAADAEYQALCERWKKATDAVNEASSASHCYAVTIGRDMGMFLAVEVHADTLAEGIAKLEAMKRPGGAT